MKNQQDLFVKMVLDQWFTQEKKTSDLFIELTDDQLMNETSPGKNRGIYLLGHLTAVHDRMLPMLDFGAQLHPDLNALFLSSPDRTMDLPAVADLREHWKEVSQTMGAKMNGLTGTDWFARHTAVSEEDYLKEPHRNKLNLIINRTNHLSSHYGQLLYLKQK
jgi:hypothetical protein